MSYLFDFWIILNSVQALQNESKYDVAGKTRP